MAQPVDFKRLKTGSVTLCCPVCGHTGKTEIERTLSQNTYFYMVLLVFCCLCWVPFVTTKGRDTTHTCPNCHMRLATWFSFDFFVDIEPGVLPTSTPDPAPGITAASLDLTRSPLGPPPPHGGSPPQKTTIRPRVLAAFEIDAEFIGVDEPPRPSGDWEIKTITPPNAAAPVVSGIYTIRGRFPSTKEMPKEPRAKSQPLSAYSPHSDLRLDHQTQPNSPRRLVADISFAPKCWETRVRLYNDDATRENGNNSQEQQDEDVIYASEHVANYPLFVEQPPAYTPRPLHQHQQIGDYTPLLLRIPVLHNLHTIVHVPSTRGQLRWSAAARAVPGYGRGWPLLDRWNRVVALWECGAEQVYFKGRLTIFGAPQTDGGVEKEGGSAENTAWVEEVLALALAVMPHQQRIRDWQEDY